MKSRLMLLGFACLALWARAQAPLPATSLDFSTKPVLVECEPGSGEPCFRLNFDFIGSDGKASATQLPPQNQLLEQLEIQVDGTAVHPFYAGVTSKQAANARHPQTAMLLLDISGSMRTADIAGISRFEAARQAASAYLEHFVDGQDRVAIVPFASRDVIPTIADALFVSTRAAAQAELDALPAPQPRNNTALYSAVQTAVGVLSRQKRPGAEMPRLLVLTDGTNDVQPARGDDAGLLTGAAGLSQVSAAVRESGVDVLPVGLGDQHSIDEIAMTRIGTRPPLITFDPERLRAAFELPQVQQSSALTVSLQPPQALSSRAALAGRVVHFRAKLTLADGSVEMEDRQALWVAPPMATPSFEDTATEAEQRAFLKLARLEHASPLLLFRPLLAFLGYSGLLAAFWFWLPRRIWPERYDQRTARPLRPEYWPESQGSPRQDIHAGYQPAPPGFQSGGRGAHASRRAPGEHTIISPSTEFDPNKTRLS